MSIEYIAEIKTWFDRINGNSYFSARITDLNDKVISVLPFQYGYGSHPEHVALKAVQNHEGIHEIMNDTYQRVKVIKHDFGKKKDCQNWGHYWGREE